MIVAAENTRLYIPILLAVGAGLRRGEIWHPRGLASIMNLGRLQINRSLEETKAGGVAFKQPKTRVHSVALPPMVIEALDVQRREQVRAMEMLGDGYSDNDLICCLPDGAIWKPSAFTSTYRALLASEGLLDPTSTRFATATRATS